MIDKPAGAYSALEIGEMMTGVEPSLTGEDFEQLYIEMRERMEAEKEELLGQ